MTTETTIRTLDSHSSPTATTQQLTVTSRQIGNNDTYNSTTGSSITGTDEVAYVASRVVFILILIGGLVANCVLLVVVGRGNQPRHGLRTPPQLNILVVGILVAANLLICMANGLWLIYAAAEGARTEAYSFRPCDFDAAAIQLVSIVWILGLMLIISDRQIAVRSAGTHLATSNREFSLRTTILLMVLAWLYAFAFSLPLVIPGGISLEGNSQRFLCTSDSKASSAYVWITAVFAYICPCGIIAAMYIGIICTTFRQRKKLAQCFRTSPSNSITDQFREQTTALAVELSIVKYVAVITVAWCLLAAPFLMLSFVRIQLAGYGRPEVSYPSNLDAVFAWLFVSHPISLPVITFVWRKGVFSRYLRKILMCCRCCTDDNKSNDSVAQNGSLNSSPKHRLRHGTVDPCNLQQGLPPPSVPVLFATPHGLHVQKSHNAQSGSVCSVDMTGNAQKCDVFGSTCSKRIFRTEGSDNESYDDITSDYNSCNGSGDAEYISSDLPIIRIVRTRPEDSANESDVQNRDVSSTEVGLGVATESQTGRTTWYDSDDPHRITIHETDGLGDSGVATMNKTRSKVREIAKSQTSRNNNNNLTNNEDDEPTELKSMEDRMNDNPVRRTQNGNSRGRKRSNRKVSSAKRPTKQVERSGSTNSSTVHRKEGKPPAGSPDGKIKMRSSSVNAVTPHAQIQAPSQEQIGRDDQDIPSKTGEVSEASDPQMRQSGDTANNVAGKGTKRRTVPNIQPRRKTVSESHAALLENSGSTVDLKAVVANCQIELESADICVVNNVEDSARDTVA